MSMQMPVVPSGCPSASYIPRPKALIHRIRPSGKTTRYSTASPVCSRTACAIPDAGSPERMPLGIVHSTTQGADPSDPSVRQDDPVFHGQSGVLPDRLCDPQPSQLPVVVVHDGKEQFHGRAGAVWIEAQESK